MHSYSLSDRIVLTSMMLILVIILLIIVHFQIKDVMITLGYSGKIKQKKLEQHIKTFSIQAIISGFQRNKTERNRRNSSTSTSKKKNAVVSHRYRYARQVGCRVC